MDAKPPGRTPPPGVRAQKTALLVARWLALVVVVIAIVIAVTSCSSTGSAQQTTPSNPHEGSGSASSSAAQDPAGQSPAPTGPSAEAVAAGIQRAASYNFTLAAVASPQDLEALRAAPQDTLEGATVDPAACRAAVQQLNWSPAQLGQDAARTDFAAQGVEATGSIEVARITDRAALDAHYATVEQMLGDCADVSLSISGSDVPLRSTTPDLQSKAVDSALLWSRAAQGSDLRQQALVLIGERDGYVAMVSFIATDGLDDGKFAQLAEGILTSTLDDLA
ncbi:hypothetical protein [Arthrobacter sp. JSM 101049]|uniref:hypothetical protein n=1 Tax=Arthrobacter sp. JSM 101049 TaxID=929097 RepID=UPI003569F8C6